MNANHSTQRCLSLRRTKFEKCRFARQFTRAHAEPTSSQKEERKLPVIPHHPSWKICAAETLQSHSKDCASTAISEYLAITKSPCVVCFCGRIVHQTSNYTVYDAHDWHQKRGRVEVIVEIRYYMSTDYLELTGIQRGRRQSHALSSAFTETIGRDQHKYDNDQNLDELQRFCMTSLSEIGDISLLLRFSIFID
ncbi:hypothetical protein CDAR_212361 [Caerostris darwini]|uniref:Uncharacterized protein n=1 Tax=Caerostris darwini TaxID=1538125 RepID=A0AAV4SAY0_9ARAC|nr:hypothetical protein CDAR_212361 [Caerostris darwini]